MSLSMQIYIQLLKRTLAKALTQHLMCLKSSVISFSVKSLIIVGASLLDQGFCMSKRSACILLCEVFGHLHEIFFFLAYYPGSINASGFNLLYTSF